MSTLDLITLEQQHKEDCILIDELRVQIRRLQLELSEYHSKLTRAGIEKSKGNKETAYKRGAYDTKEKILTVYNIKATRGILVKPESEGDKLLREFDEGLARAVEEFNEELFSSLTPNH